MAYPLYQIDAFADRPFAGNPAAVCVLEREADAGWMQAVAGEMNLSETAFIYPVPAGGWSLRWFTPAAEVELCGHATLAAAHLLWETGRVAADEAIRFATRFRGELVCRRSDDGRVAMDFPADPAEPASPPPGLVEAVGVAPVRTARSRYDWLLELRDAAAVRAATPDWSALARFETRGVIVTAPAGDAASDIVSRFFAPRLRINEDPVTGSAHCVLGPWWARRLGTTSLRCHQASARGGDVQVTVRGDRVELAGRAVTVLTGLLTATMPES